MGRGKVIAALSKERRSADLELVQDLDTSRVFIKLVVDPWDHVRSSRVIQPSEVAVPPSILHGQKLDVAWARFGLDRALVRDVLASVRATRQPVYTRIPVIRGKKRIWRGIRMSPRPSGNIVIAAYRCDRDTDPHVAPEHACLGCPLHGTTCGEATTLVSLIRLDGTNN